MPEGAPRNHFSIAPPTPRREAARVSHARLDGACRTGTLRLVFDVLAPLHVGAGEFDLHGARLVKAAATRAGSAVVPGSGIKGACRQVYEALTLSDDPFDKDHSASAGKLSAATSLFGALGYRGRVSFDDALPVEPAGLIEIRLSPPYAPRDRAGRRFYGRVPVELDKTIPAWALPVGTRLRTRLHFVNATPSELGGLLLSLGVDHFVTRLGGGKYDGCGCVRFDLEGFRVRPRDAWQAGCWVSDAAAVERAKRDWLAAFTPAGGAGAAALKRLCAELVEPAVGRAP